MKRVLFATTTCLFLATAGSAYAQSSAKPKETKATAAKGYQKVKTYDFSGDNISGDLMKPEGERVDTLKDVEHTSLIRIRKDFIREIVKSGDDL